MPVPVIPPRAVHEDEGMIRGDLFEEQEPATGFQHGEDLRERGAEPLKMSLEHAVPFVTRSAMCSCQPKVCS